MKKLMLISGCLLSSFELMAGNFVPVCLNVREERKAKVYQAIVDNSFVTQLDPTRSSRLSATDKNEIINDESGFLRKKIKSIDSSANVAFIPKSLYQLFIENYCFDDLNLAEKNLDIKDEEEFLLYVLRSDWGFSSRNRPLGFGFNTETPESISDFCNNYMNKENVKSYFWKINNSIIPFFDGISAEQVSDSKNLKKITKRLFDNISPKAKIIFDRTLGHFYRHWLMSYTGGLLTKVDTEGTVMEVDLENDLVKTIVDLVVEEGKTPENIYRIYRGEEASGQPDRNSTTSYSFSDGMFGGIVRDFESGMAFNHAISKKHMRIVDLPKEELLNVEANSNGVETSGLSVLIPPIFSMGAALGAGEFHHVRTKIQIDLSKKMKDNEEPTYSQGIDGVGVSASLVKTPWLYSYTSSIENFWNRCKLVTDKSYNISSSEVLNIRTYRLSSGKEKQPSPSSDYLIL